MTLFINTTEQEQLEFALISPKKILHFKKKIKYNESDHLASKLLKLMSDNGITMKKITRVIICTGPGGFTSTRAGAAFGIGLATGLKVEILGIKKADLPSDIKDLEKSKLTKKIKIEYNRPAVNV